MCKKTILSVLTLQAPISQKLPHTLKQFVGKLPTNCLSVFDHFVGLMYKGLMTSRDYDETDGNHEDYITPIRKKNRP